MFIKNIVLKEYILYMEKYLTWDQTEYPIQWDSNPYTWDEVFVLIEVVEEIKRGGKAPAQVYGQLPEHKKDTLIKLILTVKGEKIEQKKYKKNNVKAIVKDIKLTAEKVLGIELNLE